MGVFAEWLIGAYAVAWWLAIGAHGVARLYALFGPEPSTLVKNIETAHDEALEEDAGFNEVTRVSQEKILANIRAGYLKVCPSCYHTYPGKVCRNCLASWTS